MIYNYRILNKTLLIVPGERQYVPLKIVFMYLSVLVLTSTYNVDFNHMYSEQISGCNRTTIMLVIQSCIVLLQRDWFLRWHTPIINFTLHSSDPLNWSLAEVHKPKVNLFMPSILLLDRVAEHPMIWATVNMTAYLSDRRNKGFPLKQRSQRVQFKW